MENKCPTHEEMNDVLNSLTQARIENWLYHDLFTWKWFLLMFLFFALWAVFIKLVNRRRLFEILLYGFMIMVLTITFDEFGIELLLWAYPIKLLPVFPGLITIDYAVVPVTYMLVYQYFSSWISFAVAMVGVSAVYCFIAEPGLELLNMYVVSGWKHYYGFPIYILMALLCKATVKKLVNAEHTARK